MLNSNCTVCNGTGFYFNYNEFNPERIPCENCNYNSTSIIHIGDIVPVMGNTLTTPIVKDNSNVSIDYQYLIILYGMPVFTVATWEEADNILSYYRNHKVPAEKVFIRAILVNPNIDSLKSVDLA